MIKTDKKTEMREIFKAEVDAKVISIKGMDTNTAEYQEAFADLYEMVVPKGERKVRSLAVDLKSNGCRVDEDEMVSLVAVESLMSVLKSFNPEKNNSFITLYFYRIKQLTANYINKMNTTDRKALTQSEEVDITTTNYGKQSYRDEYAIDNDNIDLFSLINKFITVDPRGEMFKYFNLPVQSRTEHILRILGASEYGTRERQAVFKLKTKFKNFLLDNGYTLQ